MEIQFRSRGTPEGHKVLWLSSVDQKYRSQILTEIGNSKLDFSGNQQLTAVFTTKSSLPISGEQKRAHSFDMMRGGQTAKQGPEIARGKKILK